MALSDPAGRFPRVGWSCIRRTTFDITVLYHHPHFISQLSLQKVLIAACRGRTGAHSQLLV